MGEFDKIIITISDNICKNIANMEDDDRGFHSQNILNNLRNLVEAIDQRIYSEIEPIVPNNYDDIEKSVRYVASRGELRFLSGFHDYLQVSVSHYTPDEDSSLKELRNAVMHNKFLILYRAINRERDMRKTLKITQKSLQMIV